MPFDQKSQEEDGCTFNDRCSVIYLPDLSGLRVNSNDEDYETMGPGVGMMSPEKVNEYLPILDNHEMKHRRNNSEVSETSVVTNETGDTAVDLVRDDVSTSSSFSSHASTGSKKTVRISRFAQVQYTYSSEEYDRTTIIPDSMDEDDFREWMLEMKLMRDDYTLWNKLAGNCVSENE